MQLKIPLSLVTASLLFSSMLKAEDYISVQYLKYDESGNKVEISAPTLEINKDFGTDYRLNATYISDVISGASPAFTDTSSGASGSGGAALLLKDIEKKYFVFDDKRDSLATSLTKRFENRDELTTGIGYSRENDYKALELSTSYLLWSDETHNRSYNFSASYMFNDILEACGNNFDCDKSTGSDIWNTSNIINIQVGITQIIDRTSSVGGSVFYINEHGYLTNPNYNIVRNNGTNPTLENESRPDNRDGYGFLVNYAKQINKKITSNSTYRFYTDDWDIDSHTVDSNLYYEYNNKLLLGFGLRYYLQSEASFYNGAKDYFTTQTYASSDDRLSSFHTVTYKFNIDYKITDTFSYNMGLNYYDQSTNLEATYITAGFKYWF